MLITNIFWFYNHLWVLNHYPEPVDLESTVSVKERFFFLGLPLCHPNFRAAPTVLIACPVESSHYVPGTLLDAEDTNGMKPAPGTHGLCLSPFPRGESPISPWRKRDASGVQNSFLHFQGPRFKRKLQNQAAWKNTSRPVTLVLTTSLILFRAEDRRQKSRKTADEGF